MWKMKGVPMKAKKDILSIIIMVLLVVISVAGVLSLDFTKSYEVTNQFGDMIKMYGAGIYAYDSYLKAPIFIGTDICILVVLVPMLLKAYLQNNKEASDISRLRLLSVYAVAFYYAASISFGVSYNQFLLLYIALFTATLFGIFVLLRRITIIQLQFQATKGIYRFLMLSGIALIIAWLPDIIPTLINKTSLPLIEIYTTEITYILDMGIIAPLCLVSIYLLKRKDSLGTVLLAILFKACMIVGIMMIPQTICQVLSGFVLPLPVLLTKSGSFVLLGGFAIYFNHKLFGNLAKNKQ
jgi:hypothetical protein